MLTNFVEIWWLVCNYLTSQCWWMSSVIMWQNMYIWDRILWFVPVCLCVCVYVCALVLWPNILKMGFCYSGTPIRNVVWRIDWSRYRLCHVTFKDRGHDPSILGAYYLENDEYKWKWHLGYQMVMWPVTRDCKPGCFSYSRITGLSAPQSRNIRIENLLAKLPVIAN